MKYNFLSKKLDKREFKCLFEKFNNLDFSVEKNVKYFLKEVKVFAFNNKCFFKKLMQVSNSCKLEKINLSKKDKCKISKSLEPFIKFISNKKEKNFNKWNKYIKKDPEFQCLDTKFKIKQNKENYDNLVSYFKDKLPWLRKRNGNSFTFMLADDNCVPMYSSNLGDFNNYGNYHSGSITFPTKSCYTNLTFAFRNEYSRENTLKEQVIFEKLGTIFGIDEELLLELVDESGISDILAGFSAGIVLIIFTIIVIIVAIRLSQNT